MSQKLHKVFLLNAPTAHSNYLGIRQKAAVHQVVKRLARDPEKLGCLFDVEPTARSLKALLRLLPFSGAFSSPLPANRRYRRCCRRY